MRCRNCNNEINPQIPVCPYCGFDNSQPGIQMGQQMPPQGQQIYPPAGQPKKDKTKVVLICVLVGVILSIAGIVTAILLTRGGSSDGGDDAGTTPSTTATTATTQDTEEKTTASTEKLTTEDNTETVDSGKETVYDHVNGKPEKNAFDEATNKRDTWSGYSFDIPSYLGSGVEIGGGYTYYAETASASNSTSVACLTVIVADVNLSSVNFGSEEFMSTLCDSSLKSVREMDANARELSHDGVRINGMDGIWMDVQYEVMSIPVVGRVYALVDDKNSKYIMLMFQESDATEYTYFKDFEKIVQTVQKEGSGQSTEENQTETGSESKTEPKTEAAGDGSVRYYLADNKVSICFPETYDVFLRDADDYDDEMVKRSGTSEENIKKYFELASFIDLVAIPRGNKLSEDDHEIQVKVKLDSYPGMDLRKLSTPDKVLTAQALVKSLGATDYTWYTSGEFEFIVFDSNLAKKQRRYATIVDGAMIYIMLHTDGDVTDEDTKLMESIAGSFKEE